MKTIVRAPKGSERKVVNINGIQVPDLWHVAMCLDDQDEKVWSDMVLECWHLCHDLVTNIKADDDGLTL